VSVGMDHSCAIDSDAAVRCWGVTHGTPPSGPGVPSTAGWDLGQVTDAPTSGTFTQVAAGWFHNCALESSGAVQCWGAGTTDTNWLHHGQAIAPPGSFTQLSAGYYHTGGIDAAGAVQFWGFDQYGDTVVPPGAFSSIEAGTVSTCAIDATDSVQCWGYDGYGGSTPPAGSFVQVSAGDGHACAVDTNGAVQCWGAGHGEAGYNCGPHDQDCGQSEPPTGSFTQVSSGWSHSCGIRSSGEVACWGCQGPNADWGQCSPPPGTFTQVSVSGGPITNFDVGQNHSCAIATDGSMHCWGASARGQSTPP
jgi:alpha-tubulin suppressor-like RCC1 family protein